MLTRTHTPARPPRRHWRWLLPLVTLVVLGAGCNPLTMLALVMMPERLEPAECLLVRKEGPTTIAIICAFENQQFGNEVAPMDDYLAQQLGKELQKRFEDRNPKVTVVPHYQIKGFLNRNAGQWKVWSGKELGEKLGKKLNTKVDYVVNLEIHNMALFERGSRQTLYRGYADISVRVTDVEKPDGENVIFDNPFECQYPKERYCDPGDMGVVQFRAKFTDRLSREIARFFAPYEPRDRYDSD